MEELKKCPFCGGKAESFYVDGNYGYNEGYAVVRCSSCKISARNYNYNEKIAMKAAALM